MIRRLGGLLLLSFLVAGLLSLPGKLVSTPAVAPDFVHFESGHVHPAVMTPDGSRLLVVNTSDNRLSVFSLTGAAPARVAEIPVGLEPVAVACLDDQTAWVVNSLSDDVSIVDLSTMHVRGSLRVGDEPSDVVFAGSPMRAYVAVSQEDLVRIYDPASLGTAPVDIAINGRLPRALARSADGSRVYVAVFAGENRTSTVPYQSIPIGGMPVDLEFPRSPSLPPTPPRTALIVQQQGAQWKDMYGNDWSGQLPFTSWEVDVAEISTASQTVTRTFGDLGTLNFGLDVSATDGRIAVATTEARNLQLFTPRLRGHTVDTQLGLVAFDGTESVRNLNPHVDYAIKTGAAAERDSAIGMPTGVAFSPDGNRVYVTAMGSNKLAVLDPAGTGILTRVPTVAGPTGVVVDGVRGRIYVVGRFRNQLQTFSAATLAPLAVTSIGFDPTPDAIVNGRRFFYGGFTSAHGDQSCASCHPFGDMDHIAWDLGDPNGVITIMDDDGLPLSEATFDPMKGPMVTQTLRGLPGTGRLHWRADRAVLADFNVTFVELLGLTAELPDSQFTAFADFTNAMVHPPNPYERLDRTFPDAPAPQPSAVRGQDVYLHDRLMQHRYMCAACHRLPLTTNGTMRDSAFTDSDQALKIPHLRNVYRKRGFSRTPGSVNKSGFGFSHDGRFSSIEDVLKRPGFNFPASTGDQMRADVKAFVLQLDTGMPPSVGRQVTFDGLAPSPGTTSCLDTLTGQAGLNACELVARGRTGGVPRSWLFQGGLWHPDRADDAAISTAQLVALAIPGGEITVIGVPLGTGVRTALDRDRDGFFDGDERRAGSDPGNPLSTPSGTTDAPRVESGFALRSVGPNPFREATEVRFSLGAAGPVDLKVFDVAGREVRTIARRLWLDAGPQSLRWDGRSADGRAAHAGVYFVRLSTARGQWIRPVVRTP